MGQLSQNWTISREFVFIILLFKWDSSSFVHSFGHRCLWNSSMCLAGPHIGLFETHLCPNLYIFGDAYYFSEPSLSGEKFRLHSGQSRLDCLSRIAWFRKFWIKFVLARSGYCGPLFHQFFLVLQPNMALELYQNILLFTILTWYLTILLDISSQQSLTFSIFNYSCRPYGYQRALQLGMIWRITTSYAMLWTQILGPRW